MGSDRGWCTVCETEYFPVTARGCPYCYALGRASDCFWNMVLWLAAMRCPLGADELHTFVDRLLAFEGCTNPGKLVLLAAQPDMLPTVLQ